MVVGANLHGEYGFYDVNVGVPAIIGRNGIEQVLEISLNEKEREKFVKSVKIIDTMYKEAEE